MAKTILSYNFPTKIHFGPEARSLVAAELQALAKTRPLFVTDAQLMRLSVCRDAISLFRQSFPNIEVFSGIEGNPLVSHVEAGSRLFCEKNCDSIIAFGGGAAMDVAKCIGVDATHSGPLLDYEDAPGKAAIDDSVLPPVFALPTTAGTGSEVGRSAVVSDDETKIKKIIFSPGMMPRVVFLDPELQLGLPPAITAHTGMDALTHCIEAYLVDMEHPMCDGIALEGIHLVSRSLGRAVEFAKDPGSAEREEHLKARGEMMNAAMMGAVAFQKGLGVNHSCAHALSAVCDLHHGLANAIMLPHALRFNLKGESYKFQRMAEAAGCGSDGMSFIKWVGSLNESIGIPQSLSECGVKKEDLPALVEVAMQDVCHASNPNPVVQEDFAMLFELAL